MKKRRRVWIYSVVIVAIVLIGGYFALGGKKGPTYTTELAKRQDLAHYVNVTGRTVPAEEVSLAFEQGGKIRSALVKVGDEIQSGAALVRLDTVEIEAKLREAEANIATQNAELTEILRGTREEDIRVKETELAKAEQDLANYYHEVLNKLNDAYAKAEDAIRKQVAPLFTTDDTNPQFTFVLDDATIEIDGEARQRAAIQAITQWRDELFVTQTSTARSALETALQKGEDHLVTVRIALVRALDAANHAKDLAAATITSYKENINTGRTNVGSALTSVSGHSQAIASQKLAVAKVSDELALKRAGALPEQIEAQEAQVRQAYAQAEVIRAQLRKFTLSAPFSGVITEQNAEVGETVNAYETIVSLISRGEFEIEAFIPETDIANVEPGDTITFTLDAYGPDEVFNAVVAHIDPAETILEGVTTYKTTFTLSEPDARIRPRMTANVEILTEFLTDVIAVPQRAVIERNGARFIRVLRNDAPTEVEVIIGSRSSDGMIEIKQGIAEGDAIITLIEE